MFWIDYAKAPNNNVKQFLDVNPNHRNFIGEQDADRFLLELAIELKFFPTELFKDPIKHLKGICELVNQFPLPTSDTDIDILEDTKKTLEIADKTKPAITTIKLTELLHAKKFETIINQVKNLDLKIKPISKIVASAYLGKALIFLTKDESQFQIHFDKAISIKPDFYQAYADVGTKLVSSNRIDALIKSKNLFENCFTINPKIKDDTIIGHYAIALSKLARIKLDESLFEKAFVQYQNALKIQPDNVNTLNNYGSALVSLAQLKSDENLFDKAFKQFQMALKIQPNDTYNLACYYSIKNNLELSKENLLNAEKHDCLPLNPFKHLSDDKDLNNVRHEHWFIELLERLKTKEEVDKVA